ncbi:MULTISPECIES: carotenoid oxygenase family protein [unclassified Leptolyngbya]|uniref:carotenoid oxygenase family protein n=1 Tax=unclassified Leptolyngbya TaxID=2650499 RepID=UPI0016863BF5|nr:MULTISPECIES: carotenoid oxygenase family protein [unclassified Leptolyngbya]MBD1912778.1 carotenoid oxygenase family protein [Leptolyngbya sp. FACHB-8]MBD2157725.1 carotenoid oxygenase family protein [Leptolyngbya sp. FACHB-16]
MVVSSPRLPLWATAVTRPAGEFPLTPLTLLEGSIPEDLHGTLYRNGPARLERGSQRMGHWFDGDGAILAVHIGEGQATATYRYVQTAGYQAEAKADRLIFGNYGTIPSGPIWTSFGKPPKNVANTSVMVVEGETEAGNSDRLLALWEAGEPHALTLDTLITQGISPLEGLKSKPYSAHPKRDPQTGEIYNFGVSFGKEATLNLYRSDRHGRLLCQNTFLLQGIPLIHDFVLAGPYLVFAIPPVRIQILPLLLNLKSASDAMYWKPEQGTEILIFDRETLQLISRAEAEPWYQWHFGNGLIDADGSIGLTMVRYSDFKTNAYLQEVAQGQVQTRAQGSFWQIRINPQSGQVIGAEPLVEADCEFPTIPLHYVGEATPYTYLCVHRPGDMERGELFGTIARYHHPSETLTIADAGLGRYPSEPLFAPGSDDPECGWVLTVVYDGNLDRSEVWVYESDRLQEGPCCRLALPGVIPHSFHGTWKSR